MPFQPPGDRPPMPHDMGPPSGGIPSLLGPPPLMQTPIRMMPPGGVLATLLIYMYIYKPHNLDL